MRRIHLFGKAPFDTISNNQLISSIVKWGEKHKKTKVLNMNAYGVVTFLNNQKYADIIKSADIVYPDGWGPVIASKFENVRLSNRINVGDIINDLFNRIEKKRLKIYFIGCEKSVVKKVTLIVNKKYPKIKIAGFHSGFFGKTEANKILINLNNTKPNIVFVGMGIPHQENFIYNNWNELPNAVYLGVGGVFYYVANIKSRAPKWMRQISLEWLYRLFQEPARLWRRYTIINIKFIYYIIRFSILKLV